MMQQKYCGQTLREKEREREREREREKYRRLRESELRLCGLKYRVGVSMRYIASREYPKYSAH